MRALAIYCVGLVAVFAIAFAGARVLVPADAAAAWTGNEQATHDEPAHDEPADGGVHE